MLKFSPCHELQKDKADHAGFVIDPTTNAPSPTGEVDYLILNGEVDVSYTEILFAYLNTSYGRIDLGGTTLLKKGAVLSDGLKLKAVYHNNDEYDAIYIKGDNYIREHTNHFLEEVYEKIPEARNADEIIYD